MSRCRLEDDVDYRSVVERKRDQLSSQLSRLLKLRRARCEMLAAVFSE